MGLDTTIYRSVKETCHDTKTGQVVEYYGMNNKIVYFRKNYCLMEWLEKRWNLTMENCESYLIYPEDILALREDTRKCLQIINGNRGTMYTTKNTIRKDIVNKIKEIFPNNNWNSHDYNWNVATQKIEPKIHTFNEKDADDIQSINDFVESITSHYSDEEFLNQQNVFLINSNW